MAPERSPDPTPDPTPDVDQDPLTTLRSRVHEPVEPLTDRVRDLARRLPPEARPWALGSVLAGVAVVGVLWWALARGPAATDPLSTIPFAGTAPTGTVVAEPATVVVHAAGAVARPGVHRLPAGARVADAIEAAGGPTADAEPDRVNLAAPVADGARVYVPRRGEPPLPADADPAATGAPAAAGDPPGSTTIDLNRAGPAELEALPGVGPSIAGAIVDHRQRHGPFRSVDDLIEVRGIGEARLDQLRPLVRV